MKSFRNVVKGAVATGVVAGAMVFASSPASAESVVASYYGYELAGNPTASGEPFDPAGLTAAHQTLPLGTQLEVCYQGCVTVTVNDRGPYVAGRSLDLSQGAADAIGLTAVGVGTVEMNVVGSGDTGTTETAAATETATPAYDPYAGQAVAYDAYGYAYDPYTGLYY